MARDDHQPNDAPVVRPVRQKSEMRAACGKAAAFAMALDATAEGEAPDISNAVKAAQRAQVACVFVMAAPEFEAQAAVAIAGAERDGAPAVSAVACPGQAAIDRTREAGNFELFGLSWGLLEVMRETAEAAVGDYEWVLVMDAAQTGITADHVFELCEDAASREGADAACSWIQWLRRPPYLVSRRFLEQLPEARYAQAAEGARALPLLNVVDHVFGEEKLAVGKRAPQAVESFLGTCTMSALQAVRLARYALAHPDEELHSPNQKLSLTAPVKPTPLNKADALLVETAKEVLASRDVLGVDERDELAWADAFGARNRRDFPLLCDRRHADRLAYLDTAATSQRVDMALQAQRDYDEHENANVYRGAYELSASSTFTFNDARKVLEDHIGAKRRQTVYTANTTAAVNLVAQAWGEHHIDAGDVIVCELAAHHSNMLPFIMLAQRKGAVVRHVPYDAAGRIDRLAYDLLLAEKPKLVCLAQVGNVLGIEAPVADMAHAAHKAGARVLVDAAQSFAHRGIDVAELGADWVAMSAHKAYGPMGIGALWISPDAFAEMDPLGGGGGTVSHVATQSYYLRPKALQYEPGTPPVSQAVGWAAAIRYLDGLGMENVARHGAALTRHALRGLARIDGATVLGDHAHPDGQTSLVSFSMRGLAPAEVAAFLGGLDVAVRSGGHCALPLHASLGMIGSTRLSFGVYTVADEIDAAITGLAMCRRMYGR